MSMNAVSRPREGGTRGRPRDRIPAADKDAGIAASDSGIVCPFASFMERTGLEPVTPCLQSRCSPN